MNIRRVFQAMAITVIASGAVVNAGAAVSKEVPTSCDRTCLKQIADRYFESLAQHNPALLPLAREVKYTETGRVTKIGEGLWKKAGKPTYRLELLDPDTGGIGIHAVVPDGDVQTVMAARLRVQNGMVTEIETILVPKVAGAFAAPEKLVAPSHYFTRRIRVAEQSSRYELIAAADAYFRAFESEGTPDYIRAPLLPDTLRFENGVQTTNAALGNLPATTAAEQFDMAAFKGAEVADRRYLVVDQEIGAVQSLVRFGDPKGPPFRPMAGAPLAGAAFVSEIFAVTQGKIVEIQAVFTAPSEQLPTPWPVGTLPVRDH